jgi:glutathione peroxidase
VTDLYRGSNDLEGTAVTDIQNIPLTTIDGGATTLAEFAGSVVLIVNVASKCGLTPQYTALEALHRELSGRGFTVLGFPANDFGQQEPGTEAEIVEFCEANYSVTFPLFAKSSVISGDDQHPLYAALTKTIPVAKGDPHSFREMLRGRGRVPTEEPDVLWNFEKFVVGRDGTIAARFAPTVAPDDAELRAVIDHELNKSADH